MGVFRGLAGFRGPTTLTYSPGDVHESSKRGFSKKQSTINRGNIIKNIRIIDYENSEKSAKEQNGTYKDELVRKTK